MRPGYPVRDNLKDAPTSFQPVVHLRVQRLLTELQYGFGEWN